MSAANGALLLVAVWLAASCGILSSSCAGEPVSESPREAPGVNNQPVAEVDTVAGPASLALVVDPDRAESSEPVSFHLENRGEVELQAGLRFAVERWVGTEWTPVPLADPPADFPLIGIPIQPGERTEPQRWPLVGKVLEPGWYRVVTGAWYEGSAGASGGELEVRTPFLVTC
jgi:hypothetical protein